MARNRELSQLGSIVNVKDSNKHVGIGTTNPGYKLDVVGDINSRTEVRVKGVGVSTGVFIQNNGTPAGIATTLNFNNNITCLLYTSPSPRDPKISRMPSSA